MLQSAKSTASAGSRLRGIFDGYFAGKIFLFHWVLIDSGVMTIISEDCEGFLHFAICQFYYNRVHIKKL